MKKLLFSIVLLFIASVLHAGQGTASIYPVSLAPNAYHPVITIDYKPGVAANFSGGSVEIDMNPGFTPSPSTITASSGQLTAVIMIGGVTPSPVDAANITIDGYAVTINALTLNTGDYLEIKYGYTGPGLYGPAASGLYYFNIHEKTTGTSSFAAVDAQPFIYVSNVALSKSCSSTGIKAGDTVTYTITYHNNSSGYAMTGLTAWDTMPSGIVFLSSQPAPSLVTGNCYAWNIGSLSTLATNSITVTARAYAGLASYGFTSVNTVQASAMSVTGEANVITASSVTNVQGAIIIASVSAAPDAVVTGNNITVVLNMDNPGNLAASTISPSSMTALGYGTATLQNGPIPSSVATLAPNGACAFTWVFKATGAGTVYFSTHAYANDNGQVMMTDYLSSNNVVITDPTPTYTPAVPTATSTPMAPTATSVVPAASPTNTPAVSATVTPVEKVKTDRNYINIGKGDKVQIDYRVEKDGDTSIRIYNLNGELIRNFYDFNLTAGQYTGYWDGTNDSGNKVGKGIYFIVVKQPGGQTTKKLFVIK